MGHTNNVFELTTIEPVRRTGSESDDTALTKNEGNFFKF